MKHNEVDISCKIITDYYYNLHKNPDWKPIKYINDNIISFDLLINLYEIELERRLSNKLPMNPLTINYKFKDDNRIDSILMDIIGLSKYNNINPMFNSYMHYHYDLQLTLIRVNKYECEPDNISFTFELLDDSDKYRPFFKKHEPTGLASMLHSINSNTNLEIVEKKHD